MMFCPTKKWCETIAGRIVDYFTIFNDADKKILDLKPIDSVATLLHDSGIKTNSVIYKLGPYFRCL
jgi:hypothetical protein